MADTETVYAVLDDSRRKRRVIENVIVCEDHEWAQREGWVRIETGPGAPGIGWTTGDGGKTWEPPALAAPDS